MQDLLDDIFPHLKPSRWYGYTGVALALFVTAGVTLQPFAYNAEADVYFERIATAIFALHLSTLLGVCIEAFYTKGTSPAAGVLTIGSGVLATLLQVALLSRITNQNNLDGSLIILGLQCAANSLMLSFIIGDLRTQSGSGYTRT